MRSKAYLEMEIKTSLIHLLVRLISMMFFIATALIVGLDTQKKLLFNTIERKVTVHDLDCLWILTIVESVAAGYNLLQVSNTFLFGYFKGAQGFNIKFAWLSLLLDQMVAYVTFSANSAAAQGSLIAVTGIDSFQWMKACNTYTKFCIQIGGGLASGYLASLSMAVVSAFSAFNLFRLYSSTEFLAIKSRS